MTLSVPFAFLVKCVSNLFFGDSSYSTSVGQFSAIQWSQLIELAHRHRLVPHVCKTLSENGWQNVPDSAIQKLKAMQQSVVMNNCRLSAELGKIVERFDTAGLSLRPFKGPTLAIEAYGGLECRQFNDLDLMVRPDDVVEALNIFREIGYQPDLRGIDALPHHRLRYLLARTNELELHRLDGDRLIKVDLHWRYSSTQSFFETRHSQLFCDGDGRQLGCDIPTMPMEHQVVYLAYHACKHQCLRLSWLCDFAVSVHKISRKDWPIFLERLSCNSRRMVICALLMLEKLSLIDSLDVEISDISVWRKRLRQVTDCMYAVMTAEDAVHLRGSFRTGLWQWHVSGRIRPFFETVFRAPLPAEHDLLQTGLMGPWLSRFRTIFHKATAAPINGSGA